MGEDTIRYKANEVTDEIVTFLRQRGIFIHLDNQDVIFEMIAKEFKGYSLGDSPKKE